MQTDNVLLEESLEKLINYCWEDELKHFQETFEVEIQSQDNIDEWIRWCQTCQIDGENGEPSDNQPIDHIFYSLMVLKSNQNL